MQRIGTTGQRPGPASIAAKTDEVETFAGARQFSVPAWGLSVLLHGGLLAVLAVTLRFSPVGAAVEASREVGIVLKHRAVDGDYYETVDDAQHAVEEPSDARQLSQVIDDTPPSDPTDVLPPADALLGPGSLEASLNPGAERLTAGGPTPTTVSGGKARTSVFGLEGTGHKFVYVFDRSGSMGGGTRSPLAAAKAELLASLDSLEETHQFQIIFYNDAPQVFALDGQPQKLVFGTRQNKTAAEQFVGSVIANGGTRHEGALHTALRMRPDVIFFLTDGDEPSLNSQQLAQVRRLNAGASINTIQFGLGPRLGGDNFLVQLAHENGGQYVYIDVSGWYRARTPQ